MPLSIREYLERGPSTSKEIQAATGLSQSSVARQLRRMEFAEGSINKIRCNM
jgi:DNA-binding MarR family transcriptional regulator